MRLPGGFAAAAFGLLVLDTVVRVAAGAPYPGATVLLLAACGLALVPLLPRELGTPSLRVAVVPALGVGSFSLLLTTVSLVGIELTELSIRLAVAVLVVALALVPGGASVAGWSRREGVAVAALVGIFGLSLASSFDVVEPFPPPGTDWAYYLLYADEVEAQEGLLIEDPYAGEPGHVYSVQPGVGALYGSFRIVDGVSSEALARGIAAVSALLPLSLYAAVGGLFGVVAGLLAAAAYAVSSIRLETMYWHGLATTLALVFVPLVVLGLGLLLRGSRDRRAIALLGLSLASLGAAHTASALVVAVAVAAVLVFDLARRRRGSLAVPLLASVGVGAVLGAGAIVHVRRQAADLGSPVSYRFFDREWLDLDTLDYYYSWPFLALVAASVVLVAWGRERRRDPALVAFASLVLAAVVVSQLWRLHVPFEYRRVVYYAGPALAAAVGIASVGLRHRRVWVVVCAIAFLVVARESIGLRLPERLVRGGEQRSELVDALASFRGRLQGDPLLVADRCLGVRVPYVVREQTLVSAEEWQAGYTSLVPSARDATVIVNGAAEGQRLAEERGVDYVLADPACNPDVAALLDGEEVVASDVLLAVDVRR